MARPHPALVDLAVGRSNSVEVGDPEALLRSSVEHRMHGLLWSSVRRGETVLPGHIERQLALRQLETRAHHRKLWVVLEEITELLGGRGIGVATFKGVTSEARWYERVGERPSHDLDLWLDPSSIHRLTEVVQLLHPSHPLADYVDKLARRGLIQSLDLEFLGCSVDLHLDPVKVGIPIRQLASLWNRTHLLDSRRIRVVDRETSLLICLMHLLKDSYSELLMLGEAIRLLDAADSHFVGSLARQEGLGEWSMLALSTARSELGVESRDIAKAAFVESSVHTIVYRQTRRLGGSTRLAAGLRGWYVVPLTARKRTLEGVQWLVRKAFPPPELARYNVGLIRGPRFWRKLRGVQLEAIGRSARDSRKRP